MIWKVIILNNIIKLDKYIIYKDKLFMNIRKSSKNKYIETN